MKKWPFLVAAVLCAFLGLYIAQAFNTVKITSSSDYVFDESGNLYILSKDKYGDNQLTKTDRNGEIKYQKSLKTKEDGLTYTYDQIDIDDQGNLILLIYGIDEVQDENNNTVSHYKTEQLSVYNNMGNFVKDLAVVDWTQTTEVITEPYIFQFQILDDTVNFFGFRDNTWEQYKINIDSSEEPNLVQNFKLVSSENSIGDKNGIVNRSLGTTSDDRICYISQDGYFYVMDQNKQFQLIENKFSYPISSMNLNVDELDNVYILDSISGSLYSYNPIKDSFSEIYEKNSVVLPDNILLCDIFDVEVSNFSGQQVFCGMTKDGAVYVEFGDETIIISKLKQAFFPSVAMNSFIIATVLFCVFVVVRLLIHLAGKRLSLTVKMFLLVMPVLVISVSGLLAIAYSQLYNDYREVKMTSQSAVVNYLSDRLDADSLNNITLNGYDSNNQLSIDKEVKYVAELYKDSIDYIQLYLVRDGNIYLYRRFNVSEDYNGNKYRNWDTSFVYTVFPNESLSEDQQLYDLLIDMQYGANPVSVFDSDIAVYDRIVTDVEGDWLGVAFPIRNSSGEVIGIVEDLLNTDRYMDIFKDTLMMLLVISFLIIVAAFIYLLLALSFTFKPLKRLQKCVTSIGDGIWDVKVKVSTHDEISDVATAFNMMCDRINQYVSSMTALNRTSLRFLPKDLFNLMGKNKITDVSLYDMVERECHTIVADFYYGKDNCGNENFSQKKHFDKLNNNFNTIYKITSRNGGVIESYDGRGMLLIFPGKAEDAINAVLQLRDSFSLEKKYGRIRVVLGTGNMLIGVAGNEARCSMTVLSDTVLESYYINGQMDKIGIQSIVTHNMINKLPANFNFNYRYIGKSRRSFKNDTIDIYEMIDVKNIHSKNLYISTKSLFESGVKSYISGDLYNAKKSFLNVLGINEKDNVATYYLKLCNENENVKHENWEGCLF